MNVMRLFVIFILVFMLCFPMMVMARPDTGPPEWTFDDEAELDDWQDSHDLAPVSNIKRITDFRGIERSYIEIEPTGDEPYIYPGGSVPGWEPFNGYEYKTIYVGAKIEETDVWQISYITSKTGSYDAEQSQSFVVDAKPDFADLEFKMQWQYMIRGFRIHPSMTKKRITKIDYVSLRGPVVVSRPIRRLATTWGSIKDLY